VLQREEKAHVLRRRPVFDDLRPSVEGVSVRHAGKKKDVVLRKKGSASYVGE
jgi:hypothetical protein